jgi:dienelactone hydrolase
MSRRLAITALAGCVCLVTCCGAWSDDAPRQPITDQQAEKLLTREPESIDAWEARRPALVGWLRDRRGEPSAKQPVWSAGEAVQREGYTSIAVRRGRVPCGALLVPAEHVGRGPAVVYFANGCLADDEANDKKTAEQARLAGEDLARAAYVVMVLHDPGRTTADEADGTAQRSTAAATWQATTHADLAGVEFLLARREVDPDRVAVMGIGAAARRAWWTAALDERLAAVASLGTPELGTLEDQVLLSLIAPRPHRLAIDTKAVREREAAYRRWVAGPQDVYQWREVPRLFSPQLGAGFGTTPDSPAWHDTLRWLKDEL